MFFFALKKRSQIWKDVAAMGRSIDRSFGRDEHDVLRTFFKESMLHTDSGACSMVLSKLQETRGRIAFPQAKCKTAGRFLWYIIYVLCCPYMHEFARLPGATMIRHTDSEATDD